MFEYFILGILVYGFCLPIVEQLGSLILAWIEYFKSLVNLKITKVNSEINKIMEAQEPTVSYPIGFQVPSGEEEFYEEDE